MKLLSILSLLVLTAIGCNNENRTTPNVDNTAINERDRGDATMTPLDQDENQQDIDITAGIRKRVVDTDMSVNAKNVKIMTRNGRVTLRGPVGTVQEKQQIETIALAIAGEGNVDNQLEISGR